MNYLSVTIAVRWSRHGAPERANSGGGRAERSKAKGRVGGERGVPSRRLLLKLAFRRLFA